MRRVYLVTGTWPGGRKIARLVLAEDSDKAIVGSGLAEAWAVEVEALDGSLLVLS